MIYMSFPGKPFIITQIFNIDNTEEAEAEQCYEDHKTF